jgi:hypothetical protein
VIRAIEFANFKSWKNPGPIAFGRITGFFGTNSSGKSSVIQTLLLFKQTVESLDRTRILHLGDERSLIDLGTYYDLIHRHDVDLPLSFAIDWTIPEPIEARDPTRRRAVLLSSDEIRFNVVLSQRGEAENLRLGVDELHYSLGEASFGMCERAGEPNTYDLVSTGLKIKRRPGRPWPLPPPIKNYGFPDQVTGYFQNADFLSDLPFEFEDLMTDISYVGPLRENPHRIYFWSGERPATVGPRGDLAVEAILAARSEERKIGRGSGKGRRYVLFETRIASWLHEMGLIDSFAVKPIGRNRKEYEVRVRKSADSPEVLITDVGFGVSQVLPVIVQCYYAPEGSLIIFEQPEIHLHPSVQAALADVFIDAALERNVQILIESHSEHLLRRLQRRVAEEAIASDDIALYFTNVDGSSSRLSRLDVDIFGNIRNWPEGFFGDELAELTAMTAASARRATG